MHESKLRRQCGLAPFRRRRHADRPSSSLEKISCACSADLDEREVQRRPRGSNGADGGRTKRPPRRRSIDRPTGDRQPRFGGSCQSFFASRLIAASVPPRVFLRPTETCIWSRSGADDRRNRFSLSLFLALSLFSFPSIQCSNPPLLTSRRGSSTERPSPTEPLSPTRPLPLHGGSHESGARGALTRSPASPLFRVPATCQRNW